MIIFVNVCIMQVCKLGIIGNVKVNIKTTTKFKTKLAYKIYVTGLIKEAHYPFLLFSVSKSDNPQ